MVVWSDNDNIISIHAPRMGSDATVFVNDNYTEDISIHAPRMGSDL